MIERRRTVSIGIAIDGGAAVVQRLRRPLRWLGRAECLKALRRLCLRFEVERDLRSRGWCWQRGAVL